MLWPNTFSYVQFRYIRQKGIKVKRSVCVPVCMRAWCMASCARSKNAYSVGCLGKSDDGDEWKKAFNFTFSIVFNMHAINNPDTVVE